MIRRTYREADGRYVSYDVDDETFAAEQVGNARAKIGLLVGVVSAFLTFLKLTPLSHGDGLVLLGAFVVGGLFGAWLARPIARLLQFGILIALGIGALAAVVALVGRLLG